MWPLKRGRHPDMNVNDLDYSITYPIVQNFDIDRSWEVLAAAIGYSTNQIQTFELEQQRAHGSPTRMLMRDWGSRGATVRDFYNKLALINKTQSMRLLEPIVHSDKDTQKEKPLQDKSVSSASLAVSMESKSDNFLTMPSNDPTCYNPETLPIPSMKKRNTPENVNLNNLEMHKSCNKPLDMFTTESGAASNGAIETTASHADGPASTKGNMGAASSAIRSFDRVRSVVEGGTHSPYMQGLSHDEMEVAQALMSTPNYTYKELSQATEGFSIKHKLGQGKFGAVYSGMVKNTKCAIKKLLQKREGSTEEGMATHMTSELKALSRYRHDNIVSLYGYALDGDEVCLVYQFMMKGSLYDCLHCKAGQVLTWEQRLAIVQGAACGLQFLHTVDKKPVIHGDIKSPNILLTQHYEAKIGDLGLAKQATGGEVTGKMTHITKKTTSRHDYENRAYYAPEICRGNGFSIKGDTYAFGVVMFECLTGKVAYDDRREGSGDEKYLVGYIENEIEECPKLDKQKSFQDSALKVGFPVTIFSMLFDIAQRCVEEKKKNRPEMVEVYKQLEKCETNENYENVKVNSSAPVQRPDSLLNKNSKPGRKADTSTGCLQTSYMSGGSYTPDLKSPQNPTSRVSQDSHRLQSPIDMLPPNQPMPEAFKLALEQDKRKLELDKEPQYTNVSQLTDRMKDCMVADKEGRFSSDPKKLAEIEKYENNFSAPNGKAAPEMSGKLPSAMHGIPTPPSSGASTPDRPIDQNLTLADKIAAKEQEAKMDEVRYASDPKKLAMLERDDSMDTSQCCGPDYVNVSKPARVGMKEVQEFSFDEQDDCACKPTENMEPNNSMEYEPSESSSKAKEANTASNDCFKDFSEELAEIQHKAIKGDSSMMGIFEWLDHEKKSINIEGNEYEYYNDDNMDDEFDIHFDFDATEDESESSTITESINNDLDAFNSADITDEALFAQESDPPYVNVSEKICNNSMEARLEHHQSQLSHYQEMLMEDENDDDLQERAVQSDSRCQGQQMNDIEIQKGRVSTLQKGQVCVKKDQNSSSPVSVNSGNNFSMPTSQCSQIKTNNLLNGLSVETGTGQGQPPQGQSQLYVNADALKFHHQHSPREPSEGDCYEYV